jgi:prepilin-type N-terminal cleavage/methylation domain-containing protein
MEGKIMKGFTLIEVLVYLSILAVLFGLASSSFLQSSDKHRLQKAVWEIHAKLNYARFKAIFDGTKFRVLFNPNGYTVEKYNQDSGEWKVDAGNILEGVFIQANNIPIFHPQGTVSNLASILISNTWGCYKISLAISGRIKIAKQE